MAFKGCALCLFQYYMRPLQRLHTSATLQFDFGSLAQLVEQLTFNQLVAGSNPARPTIVKPAHIFLRVVSSAGRAVDF